MLARRIGADTVGLHRCHCFTTLRVANPPPAGRRRRRAGRRSDADPSRRQRGAADEQWTPGRHGVVSLAPFVPTPDAGVGAVMRLAALQPDDVFADLGCGDGRLVAAAARNCKLAIGIELDSSLVAQAKQVLVRGRLPEDNARIIQGDAAAIDLAALGVSHAFVFMSPEGNER